MANLYRVISIGALVLLLIPFVTNQLKVAVFPQLERSGGILDYYHRQSDIAPSRSVSDASMTIQKEQLESRGTLGNVAKSRALAPDLEEVVVTSSRSSTLNRYEKKCQSSDRSGRSLMVLAAILDALVWPNRR